MTIAGNIKALREDYNLSQAELGKIAGVSDKAVSTWEIGVKIPRMGAVEKIAQYFSIPKSRILDNYFCDNNNTIPIHTRETALLDKYRALNSEGKDQADDYVTMLAETPKYTDTPLDKVQTSIIYYDIPVSAGTGQFLSDSGYIMLDVMETPPQGAEFIVRVCGDSMEPTYKDGDKLYIAPAEQVNPGEIGIFSLGGEVFVKECGAGELVSHNPNYAPIRIGESDDVHCFGKVVGVCKKYR